MSEDLGLFEKRKEEHIEFALRPECEAYESNALDTIKLRHEALPDLNVDEITLSHTRLGVVVPTPFIVSSMTAGHDNAELINYRLMEACSHFGWGMGVGSQRRELFDEDASLVWWRLRQSFPNVSLFGNLGIAQAIQTPLDVLLRLIEKLQASAFIIHTNPLQEMIQPEGTPSFKGALEAIHQIAHALPVPLIIKETGCGFSKETFKRLSEAGVRAVDVSGLGGTHWGRVEGFRAGDDAIRKETSVTFKNWGISTVQSVLNGIPFHSADFEIWGSGGVRHGLDAARLLAMGATTIGFAKPALQRALLSEEALHEWMMTIAYELKTAMFCTDSRKISDLRGKYDI